MKLVNYRCEKCGREQKHLYMSGEKIPSHVRCDCEPMDVYAERRVQRGLDEYFPRNAGD
jgi:hypothetical protein